MIAISQQLARISKVLLLVHVTLVTRATAKPVATVSCRNLLGTKSIWIACVVNLTFSSLKNILASKYTSMINAHKRIKKKEWKCNWELEAHWLVRATGKVSPNWSQETMIFHSSNCCVWGTRTQPLIFVGCSVHYWMFCAINKEDFFVIAFSSSSSTHICFAFEALAYVLPHFDALTHVAILVSSTFIFQRFAEVWYSVKSKLRKALIF